MTPIQWADLTIKTKGLEYAYALAEASFKVLPLDKFWINAFGYLKNKMEK